MSVIDVQLALPFDCPSSALDAVVDAVRKRFGTKSVSRAVLLGNDGPPEMPLLPD